MNENSLIRDIGRSFIVSSFLPASLFITLAIVLFRGFIPDALSTELLKVDDFKLGQWTLLLFVISWIGFCLYSGWNFTVKLYEGYYFPGFIARLFKKYLSYVKNRNVEKITRIKQLTHADHELSGAEIDELVKGKWIAIEDFQKIELWFPFEDKYVMATRLGNVLRASERYSWDRYRIEGVTFFSRLVHLFPTPFANQLEEANNRFIFLLNSAFLCMLIGFACFWIVLLRGTCYVFNPNLLVSWFPGYVNNFCPYPTIQQLSTFQKGFATYSGKEYLGIGLLFFLIGYALYRVAVIAANTYARLVRTGFDLYRFDLLKSMHIDLPSTLKDEQALWLRLSQFIISGQEMGDIVQNYVHPTENKDGNKLPHQEKGTPIVAQHEQLNQMHISFDPVRILFDFFGSKRR